MEGLRQSAMPALHDQNEWRARSIRGVPIECPGGEADAPLASDRCSFLQVLEDFEAHAISSGVASGDLGELFAGSDVPLQDTEFDPCECGVDLRGESEPKGSWRSSPPNDHLGSSPGLPARTPHQHLRSHLRTAARAGSSPRGSRGDGRGVDRGGAGPGAVSSRAGSRSRAMPRARGPRARDPAGRCGARARGCRSESCRSARSASCLRRRARRARRLRRCA